jgi:hypothetical protein
MSTLLERAFEEARRLPESEQDALAAILLEEIESEERWEKSFAESQDVLRKMANEALREAEEGEVEEFGPDDL